MPAQGLEWLKNEQLLSLEELVRLARIGVERLGIERIRITGGEPPLASSSEAVAASFPGASVSVEREYRNALRGYALRVPAGSIDVIRSVSGVQAAYPDGNNSLQ